jgi:3-oxoacyl-[acyl-carrier protein] reductase
MTRFDIGLDGRRVVLLGGGGVGIGSACTLMFAGSGARVAVVDRDQERVDDIVRRADEVGDGAVGVVGDVMDAGELDAAMASAERELGGIDSLVTVVGGLKGVGATTRNRLVEQADEVYDRVFELNLHYVFRAVRTAVAAMIRSGRGGSIVGVGSIAGCGLGSPGQAEYGAAKSALNHLAATVSAEYGPEGVRMNIVAPGWIETPVSPQRDDASLERILQSVPQRRRGTIQDIANAVVFLASPASQYVSGEVLKVDGGASSYNPFVTALHRG